MTFPNWNELNWYHFLALGDVVVILALLVYFATGSRLKIPAIFMGILGGMGVGAALGAAIVIAMLVYGVKTERDWTNQGEDATPTANADGKAKGGMGKGGMGKGGMGKGGMGKGGMGKGGMGKGGTGKGGTGGRGATPQTQLATLITKLDLLTHKPLAVSLDAEQQKKVRESLDKLDTEKSLSDDKARTKLEELRKILNEDQRKTLEVAGYRWPAQAAAPSTPGTPPAQEDKPNPFSTGEDNKHLKSLLGESK